MIRFTISAFLLLSSIFVSAQTEISIDSVSIYVGQVVKVCDKVAGTFTTKGEKPVTYLNLGADYPNTKLTIVIFQKDLINFPSPISEHYKNKDICITGEVGVYKEKYQIIANKPEQIELK